MAAQLLVVVLLLVAVGAVTEENLEFYMHDNFNLTPKTVIRVAAGSNSSSTFGSIQVVDDPLTRGPSLSSEVIGRGQGAYVAAQLDGNSLLLTFTAVFTGDVETLSFHGADDFRQDTREIAVIGGTGKYRMATGYAIITTTSNTNLSTILHFNVTLHV